MPARRFCIACTLVETRPADLRPAGVLLGWSLLHRAGKDIVTPLPSAVAIVQEEGEGASFSAPVDGDPSSLAPGDRVIFRSKSWPIPDGGGNFDGIVVAAEETRL